MTGFGDAHCQRDDLAVAVEMRTINSRYLKLTIRTNEAYGSLEPMIESEVRKRVRRGTILVNVRVDRVHSAQDYRVNAEVLESYRHQLEAIGRLSSHPEPVPLATLLLLPGVVCEETGRAVDVTDDWPVIRDTLSQAMDALDRMRAEEGRTMCQDLLANCRAAAASLAEIDKRAPLVVEAYRGRLKERLEKLLAEYQVTLDPADLIKEVSLFAERSDISEEVVRLRSHLDQFEAAMESPECSGRKLEFLTQEMVREGNTIASKANDVEISRHAIEIKAAIERIREMIQNVE
jgi:uncharacterized protein (TIGR00255 family)